MIQLNKIRYVTKTVITKKGRPHIFYFIYYDKKNLCREDLYILNRDKHNSISTKHRIYGVLDQSVTMVVNNELIGHRLDDNIKYKDKLDSIILYIENNELIHIGLIKDSIESNKLFDINIISIPTNYDSTNMSAPTNIIKNIDSYCIDNNIIYDERKIEGLIHIICG